MTLLTLNIAELKALVIDDSRTQRMRLRKVLSELGVHTVCDAEDGADAMQRLRGFPADVAICDLHMTPLDGIEFTRLLRNSSDSPNPYLPLLMLTADATELQLKNALAAGVNDFMSKPIEREALRRHLLAMFARPFVFVHEERALRPIRPHCAPHEPDAVEGDAPAAAPQGDAEARPVS